MQTQLTTEQALAALSQKKRDEYNRNRANYFKGTITVCVIYGVLALVLFILSVASQKGRELLSTDLLAFTVTFIGGMLFVIIALSIAVLNYKPPVVNASDPTAMVCPDYWELEQTPDDLVKTADAKYQYMLKWRCKRSATNSPILGDGVGAKPNTYSVDGGAQEQLHETLAPVMYSGSKNLDCNYVYPYLMSVKDYELFKDNPNKMRCQYARECNTPWTSSCPSIPSSDQ
jgi:hypothetical protein